MYYAGESNVPGAPGNLMAGNPFGNQFVIPGKRPAGQPVLPGEQREFVEGVYGVPGPKPIPGSSPLGLPMAAMGNMGGMIGQMPQGPNTPLPAPGWNPNMIKPPGNPNFRPSPMWERPGPTPGSTMPWQAAGFQNKTIS